MDLDERKAAILRAIVEEHVATAQPVGSQTIARSRGLGVSSATVRNDMTVLEREGYLVAAAHVGRPGPDRPRLPLLRRPLHRSRGSLPGRSGASVADFFTLFTSAHQVLEDLLHETSQLLARVSTPHRGGRRARTPTVATVRSVQLVTPPALAGAGAGDPVERQRREVRAAPRRRRRRRHRRHRRLRCSTRSSSGARWGASPTLRPAAGPAADTLARRSARCARRRGPSTESSSRSTSAARAGSRRSRRRSPPPTARRACSSCSSTRSRSCRSCATCSTRAPPCASAPRTRSTSCATARSSSRPTRSTARSPAPSACSAPPAWTTARRSPRSKPSPSNSADVLS